MTTFTQSLSRKVTAINPNATGYEINNLIYTQKTISKDLSATAIDMQKANTILATWGKKEDPDLMDITDKMNLVLNNLQEALESYSRQNEVYRKNLKEIRESEENLFVLNQKKKNLENEILKLNKIQKPKKPQEHDEKLRLLMSEVAVAEKVLLNHVASNYALKRQKLHDGLQLQFDSLAEFAAKAQLIVQHGRDLTDCIPQVPVAPGENPPVYTGHYETQQIVDNLSSALIAFSPASVKLPTNHSRIGTGSSSNSFYAASTANGKSSYGNPNDPHESFHGSFDNLGGTTSASMLAPRMSQNFLTISEEDGISPILPAYQSGYDRPLPEAPMDTQASEVWISRDDYPSHLSQI